MLMKEEEEKQHTMMMSNPFVKRSCIERLMCSSSSRTSTQNNSLVPLMNSSELLCDEFDVHAIIANRSTICTRSSLLTRPNKAQKLIITSKNNIIIVILCVIISTGRIISPSSSSLLGPLNSLATSQHNYNNNNNNNHHHHHHPQLPFHHYNNGLHLFSPSEHTTLAPPLPITTTSTTSTSTAAAANLITTTTTAASINKLQQQQHGHSLQQRPATSFNNSQQANGHPQQVMSCANGLLTFELSTGFIYKPTSAETLVPLTTLQLTDCLDFCLHNSSCLAINFEVGLCVLLSSSAKQNPANLYSSQFPVFTIYAEKKCLLAGDPQANKQARRCQRAWTFERVAGYEMKTRPRRRLKFATKEHCMEACLLERDFECRSANWYRQTGECTLSDQDRHSVSQSEAGDQHIKSSLYQLYGPSNLTTPTLRPNRPASPPPSSVSPPPAVGGLYQNYYSAGFPAMSSDLGVEQRTLDLLLMNNNNNNNSSTMNGLSNEIEWPMKGRTGRSRGGDGGGGGEIRNKYRNIRQVLSELARIRQNASSLLRAQANRELTNESLQDQQQSGFPRDLMMALEQVSTRQQQQQQDWPPMQYMEIAGNFVVDYLENNCIYEPNKLCEFRKIQNRVLKTVDSIYQEVGSLEECKQKCLNAPYRCYSFDYGDTSERMCRTSHLDQASLLSVKEPYLDMVGAITYELASCFNVTIQCRAREMVAIVSSSKTFRGKIYVKSRPSSCVNDVKEALHFELSMRYHDQQCDVRASSSQYQGVFSNDIVIQHHDRIVTTQDVGLSVYCQYDLGNRSITNNVDLAIERIDEQLPLESKNQMGSSGESGAGGGSSIHSPLTITSLATTVVRSPNVTMRITNMNGQPVASATVGDRLALLFEIKEKSSPFGIFVREIIAMDGRQLLMQPNSITNNNNKGYHYASSANSSSFSMENFEEQLQEEGSSPNLATANSIQFIDSNGCPTDANIMGPLVKMDPAGHRILAPFDAFKFPTSDMVFFRAVVTSCIAECKPIVCPNSGTDLTSSASSTSSPTTATSSTTATTTTTTSGTNFHQPNRFYSSTATPHRTAELSTRLSTTLSPPTTMRGPANPPPMQAGASDTVLELTTRSDTSPSSSSTKRGLASGNYAVGSNNNNINSANSTLQWASPNENELLVGSTETRNKSKLTSTFIGEPLTTPMSIERLPGQVVNSINQQVPTTTTTASTLKHQKPGDSLTTVAGFQQSSGLTGVDQSWQQVAPFGGASSSVSAGLEPERMENVSVSSSVVSESSNPKTIPNAMTNNHPPQPLVVSNNSTNIRTNLDENNNNKQHSSNSVNLAQLEKLSPEQKEHLVELFENRLKQHHLLLQPVVAGAPSEPFAANNATALAQEMAEFYASFLTSVLLNGIEHNNNNNKQANYQQQFATSGNLFNPPDAGDNFKRTVGKVSSQLGEGNTAVIFDEHQKQQQQQQWPSTAEPTSAEFSPLDPPENFFHAYNQEQEGVVDSAGKQEANKKTMEERAEQIFKILKQQMKPATATILNNGSSFLEQDAGPMTGSSGFTEATGGAGGDLAMSASTSSQQLVNESSAGRLVSSAGNNGKKAKPSEELTQHNNLTQQQVVILTPTSGNNDNLIKTRSQQQISATNSLAPTNKTKLSSGQLLSPSTLAPPTQSSTASSAAAAAAKRKRDKNLQAFADSYMGGLPAQSGKRVGREKRAAGRAPREPSSFVMLSEPQDAPVAASVVRLSKLSPSTKARFTRSLVQMYHTGTVVAPIEGATGGKKQEQRFKRDTISSEAQPFYDLDTEMVVQSIKIVDRLQFEDEEDEMNQSNKKTRGRSKKANETSKQPASLVTQRWQKGSNNNNNNSNGGTTLLLATTNQQQSVADSYLLQQSAADDSTTTDTDHEQQRRLIVGWSNPAIIGLVMLATCLVLVQVSLVAVCLLDWRRASDRRRRVRELQQLKHRAIASSTLSSSSSSAGTLLSEVGVSNGHFCSIGPLNNTTCCLPPPPPPPQPLSSGSNQNFWDNHHHQQRQQLRQVSLSSTLMAAAANERHLRTLVGLGELFNNNNNSAYQREIFPKEHNLISANQRRNQRH